MATSLGDLITQVRQRSDMEATQYVTDELLTTWINASLSELEDLITGVYEDYRLANFESIIPNDGVSNVIPIPSVMNKLRGVDYLSANGQWSSIRPFQFPERNRGNNSLFYNIYPWNKFLTYRFADQGIIITPQSVASGTFQVWYTPKFINLTQTTDLVPIQMDLNARMEYAVVDVCVKVLNKQNLDPSGFLAEKAALEKRIRGALHNRDSAGPKVIADVRSGYNNGFFPDYYGIF